LCQPETDEDLIEDQHDAALVTHLPQLLQPFGVRLPIEPRLPAAVHQGRVGRCRGVRVQRLQRVDQHARDIPPPAQHIQRPIRHFCQRISIVRR
jgi:hypothetical protein